MNTTIKTNADEPKGALAEMALRIGADPDELMMTLKEGVFKKATAAEFQALVLTAQEYQLNPILKELYAFPSKGGGIVPIVSIDGWLKIINRQPNLDGIKVEFSEDGENATCTIHMKNRTHPVVVTESLAECKRPTDPWKTMPRRMLRHKAIIQAARVAFGIGGVYDEDEGKDAAGMRDATPARRSLVARDQRIDPSNLSAASEVVALDDANPEKKEPEGRQKKERHLRDGVIMDVTKRVTQSGKNLSIIVISIPDGKGGEKSVEFYSFSESLYERILGRIGDHLRITFTQGGRGGFQLEDFEEIVVEGGLV